LERWKSERKRINMGVGVKKEVHVRMNAKEAVGKRVSASIRKGNARK
jgi:hypothetical protein